jgi:DUF1680 family protein
MSCYEGLLELYRITGKEEYKHTVELAWENIRDTEINIAGSGASAEMWFGGKGRQARPVYHYQETCVTVTWIKLSHQLLRLTGNPKYADAVEQTFYNALLGSLNPTNHKWSKYTPLVGQRLPGSGQCGMDLNCCEASGPRGLFNIPAHIVMTQLKGIAVNYYVPGQYQIRLNNQLVQLIQETQYPEIGSVRIQIGLQEAQTFTISVRIPEWSSRNTVKINGQQMPVQGVGYLALEREWKNGDTIELDLDMRGRVMHLDQHVAILRGPVLLARDSQWGGTNLTNTLQPIVDEEDFVELQPSPYKHHHTWMEFSAAFIPESYTEEGAQPIRISLCDYASAGYGTENSTFKVWIPELQDPRK